MIMKYRAWSEKYNEMLRIVSINFDEEYIRGLSVIESNLDIESSYSFSEVELLQSTGMKDRFDEEIFEGDIVKYLSGDNFEITSSGPGDWYMINAKDSKVLASYVSEVEIVGNKFENLDLDVYSY